MRINRTVLERSLAMESYEDFVRMFWGEIVADPLEWNWHMSLFCQIVQDNFERVFKRQPKECDTTINCPPSTSKSTIFTIMSTPWAWTRMPSFWSINISFGGRLAQDLSRRSRDVFLSQKYQRIFPHVRMRRDESGKGLFMNQRGGGRFAVGTGGVTGYHGHVIIIDDPLDPKKALSNLEIDNCNLWLDETTRTRTKNRAVTPTLLIHQRLHPKDPTGHQQQKTGKRVKHYILPAEGTTGVKPQRLKDNYTDALLDKNRLPTPVLRELEIDMGPISYAAQFQQLTDYRGGKMFDTSKFQLTSLGMQQIPAIKWVRFWDKAATQDAGCFTVGVLMGVIASGIYYIPDVVRGQWNTDNREAQILQTAKIDGPNVVVWVEEEGGSGGKDSSETTKKMLRKHGFKCRAERPTGDKVWRADSYAGAVNGGRVFIAKARWNHVFIDEHRNFPSSQYKDIVDAAAGAYRQVKTKPIVAGIL